MQPGAPLAFYTGELPTPMAVAFSVSSLRVTFRSRAGNRNAGFNISYLADGSCFNDCGPAGAGACRNGLCACPPEAQGADCSVPVPALVPLPVDDAAPGRGAARQASGTLQPGQVAFFAVDVPAPEAGANAPGLLLELTLPDAGAAGGGPRPAPLLLLLNATAAAQNASAYVSGPGGLCNETLGCYWAMAPAAAPDAPPRATLAGRCVASAPAAALQRELRFCTRNAAASSALGVLSLAARTWGH